MQRITSSVARLGRHAASRNQNLTAPAMGFAAQRATTRGYKVVVCGGSGGIGQPMSLLMAMDQNVTELVVQDVSMAMVPAAGVAADLGHIETKVKVSGVAIDPANPVKDQVGDGFKNADLVLVPAGLPRKPGMTRDDLFATNAGIAKGIIDACAAHCPNAMVALIVNPVNSVVPAMAEYWAKKHGLDPMRVFGVTTLDVVRANKFVAEATGADPSGIDIPVVGGHAGITILPLFSQDKTASGVTDQEKIKALDVRTQDGGTEVVNAKGGKGSATLSMAYSGARLGRAVLSGLAGKPVTEAAYVKSTITDLPYFSSKVTFGPKGIEKVHDLGPMNDYEKGRLEEVKKQLKTEIDKGLEFAAAN